MEVICTERRKDPRAVTLSMTCSPSFYRFTVRKLWPAQRARRYQLPGSGYATIEKLATEYKLQQTKEL